jgi:hypothetical protein
MLGWNQPAANFSDFLAPALTDWHHSEWDLRGYCRRTGQAATVAQSSYRLRQLMTSTLLSPSHIAAPVPGRYLIGDGYPPPTATVRAAFDRQNANRSLQDHRSDPAHRDQNQPRGDYSPVVPVPNRKISACTGAKSP